MNIDDLKTTDWEEKKEYVFISYSSNDKERVFGDYVLPLHKEHGLRVYCDRNFQHDATSAWVDQMTDNMSSAKVCVVFMSNTYASSYACMLEVFTAILYEIPIIKVQLEQLKDSGDDKDVREISDYTKNKYVDVMDLLKNNANQSVGRCINLIKPSIVKDKKISKLKVSKSFIPLLKSISGTTITELMAVKNSIEKVDKNTFEDIKIDKSKDNPKDEPKNEPKDEPTVDTDKTKGKKDNKNINISAKINQILMVVDRVKSEPNTNDYQAAVNSAAEYVSRELEVTRSAVTDKCQRQLGLSAKEFQDLLMKHIVNNDDELFNIVLEQAKTDEEKEAVRETFKINSEITDSGNEEIVSEDTPVKEKGNLEVYYIDNVRKEGNQAKMMWDVFEALAEKYPEKIADLTQISNVQLSHNVTNPGTKESNPTCFMSYKSFMVNGQEYLVGTCYNKADKLRRISKMLNICGAPADFFVIE